MRRKVGERDIRKLVRIGKTSLGVTIPIESITNLKWKAGQKVVVIQKGQKIVIEDWPAK